MATAIHPPRSDGRTSPSEQTDVARDDVTIASAYDLIEQALAREDGARAEAIAEQILEHYPSDLRTHLLLGRARAAAGFHEQAIRELDLVVDRDPENVDALVELSALYHALNRFDLALDAATRAFELDPERPRVRDQLRTLRGQLADAPEDLPLAPPAAVARWQIQRGDPTSAVDVVSRELAARPRDVALQLIRSEALWRADRLDEAERACRQLVTRLPRTIKPRLILGIILSSDPEREADGVELLHATLTEDLAGDVARRLGLGTDVELPSLAVDVRVSFVSAARGVAADAEAPEDIASTPDAEDRTATTVPTIVVVDADSASDGSLGTRSRPSHSEDDDSADDQQREDSNAEGSSEDETPAPASLTSSTQSVTEETLPSQVLLAVTLRQPLVERYGQEAVERLNRRGYAVRRELARFGTGFELVFLDDVDSMGRYEAPPIDGSRPDDIRRATQSLVHYLGHRNAIPIEAGQIGVLLLGGDDVIPHFRVPNPTDDDDGELLTDNFYGLLDGGSAWAPDVPVGRLPTGSADNLSLLLRQLDLLVDARRRSRLRGRTRGITGIGLAAIQSIGLGRSPASPLVWSSGDLQSVASDVITALPSGGLVRASPPASSASFDPTIFANRRCVHLSLNGSVENNTWFGQPLPSETEDGWQAVVAVSAEQLVGLNLAGPVVFAACSYSAAIDPNRAGASLAVRLLQEGAVAFIGPTALGYGSDLPPLAGADLLGQRFWHNLVLGRSVGAALLAARREYVARMAEEQGYLDGEDQKTLLEFCLYGDPLLPVFECSGDAAPPEHLDVNLPLICNQNGAGRGSSRTAGGPMRAAIELLTSRCPEAAAGKVRFVRREGCRGECGHPAHAGPALGQAPGDFAITALAARVEIAGADGCAFAKFARISLDGDGKISKVLISR